MSTEDPKQEFSDEVVAAYLELQKHEGRPKGAGWACTHCGYEVSEWTNDSSGDFAKHQLEAIVQILREDTGESDHAFIARVESLSVGLEQGMTQIGLVAFGGASQADSLALRSPVVVTVRNARSAG